MSYHLTRQTSVVGRKKSLLFLQSFLPRHPQATVGAAATSIATTRTSRTTPIILTSSHPDVVASRSTSFETPRIINSEFLQTKNLLFSGVIFFIN